MKPMKRMMTKTKGRVAAAADVAVAVALASWLAVPAHAQTVDGPGTVDDIVGFLVTNRGVQTSDFDRDRQAADATRVTIGRALLASIATLPTGSSSGGFTYRFNPELGTVERASPTFGPFFVERAVTAGRGQASAGVNVRYMSFDSLDGSSLRDGELITTANQFSDEPAPFDVDALTLEITTRTATFFGNVGVSDRIDVGVAVPFVQLSVSGSRVNTYRGTSLVVARARGESSGIGDVLLRSKVRLTNSVGPGAAAAGVEVRLPTGRGEDLLGAGEPQLRMLGVGTLETSPVSVHGNLSVGVGGIGRELAYGGAVAIAATPRVTMVGEFLARRVSGLRQVVETAEPHPRVAGVMTTRLAPVGPEQTSTYLAGGFKWNLAGAWLLHGNVLLPLNGAGLTSGLTPAVALDYSFIR
jgi:hypothetical protein